MTGLVRNIFTCANKGEPMIERMLVMAIEGRGIENDRYFYNRGAWSAEQEPHIRHVTLVEEEAIDDARALLGEGAFFASETRRNIVTLGVSLNELVGKEFLVGTVRARGVELADPCKRPSALVHKRYFELAFRNRGGLRAEFLSSGQIRRADPITLL